MGSGSGLEYLVSCPFFGPLLPAIRPVTLPPLVSLPRSDRSDGFLAFFAQRARQSGRQFSSQFSRRFEPHGRTGLTTKEARF